MFMNIKVFPDRNDLRRGKALFGESKFKCSLGKGGVKQSKIEGDGATPIGKFPLRQAFYRADRIPKPDTRLPIAALTPRDGWCDSIDDEFYNRFVTHPYKASAEKLWRTDSRYDIIIVVGYNDDPIVPGLGSAIFIHAAAENYAPTEGCIAFDIQDLIVILNSCKSITHIDIREQTEN